MPRHPSLPDAPQGTPVGRRLGWALAALLLPALPSAAAAQPYAPAPPVAAIAAGRAIALNGVVPGRPACAACHMPDGAGQPDVGIPRLAGLSAIYLQEQLDYFATGKRRHPAMAPYAKMLDAQQRHDVAAYFATLAPPPSGPLPSKPAAIAEGAALFAKGDYRTGLLACANCHGPTGLGVEGFSPRLAGQSAPYVLEQLHHWHRGGQRDPAGAFMRAEASHLTAAQIKALADYIATMGAVETQKP